MKKRELILTFDKTLLGNIISEGLHAFADTYITAELMSDMTIIRPRYTAEPWDCGTVHPIPYVILYNDIEDSIFLYRRGSGVGESRLAGNTSCGIGGHVDVDQYNIDLPPMAMIQDATNREINEELGQPISGKFEFIGTLYDTSNDVGKVHLGMVAKKTIDQEAHPGCNIVTAESELHTIGFVKLSEIDVECPEYNFENWSKIAIKFLQSQSK